MLESRRLRTALAVDAVATALAGILVYARPGLLGSLFPDRGWLDPLGDARTASRIGLAVATFGAGKGLLYALAIRRYGVARASRADGGERRD